MFRGLLCASALLLSGFVNANEVRLVTPSICPIICAADENRDYSHNGIINVLEDAIAELGHHLVVEFESGARSRIETSIGMADLTLGAPFELKKSSRLDLIDNRIGVTPVLIVYHPERPLNITSLKDLMNYRLVWNDQIMVDERFSSLFDTMRANDKMDIIPPKDFQYNGLKRIHEGHADIMMLSKARFEDVFRRLRRSNPSADFRSFQAERIPGYDINLALSTKTWLSEEEQQHIRNAVNAFDHQQSEASIAARTPSESSSQGQQNGGLAMLLKAMASGQPLPPQALAKIKQIPATMLDQIGEKQKLSPEMLGKLKQLHASLQ
jgi:hypothetical protein